jgi:hypothetical protein
VWVEPLSDQHLVADFSCGKKPLDDWLAHYALENGRRRLSNTYVLSEDGRSVIGYYSITMGGTTQAELPRKLGRGLPTRIDIGCALLARLAVAIEWAHRGLGTSLLVHAVQRIVFAAETIAARFVAVDPLDEEARQWYAERGFTAIDGDEGGRMFLRLDDAIRAFEETDWSTLS